MSTVAAYEYKKKSVPITGLTGLEGGERYMIRYIYLTAIGMTPGGSITRHIYIQTKYIERRIWEVRAVPRLCELYPGICLTTEGKARKTSVRVAQYKNNEQAQYKENEQAQYKNNEQAQYKNNEQAQYKNNEIQHTKEQE